ncbi:MAG: hypothetical protein J7K75_06140 [Desulfuromonas sp.]|nr:hypothetical protein [Desulfuromonas sp.]
MEIFVQLSEAIEREHQQGELPDYLLEPLQQVAQQPQQFADRKPLVEKLLVQLNGFDAYCDCGCFAEGYNSQDLSNTLQQLGSEICGVASTSSCSL